MFKLFLSSSILASVSAVYSDWKAGQNPGMMLRVDEESISGLKVALKDFLPHYLNADLRFNDYYKFDVGLGDILGGLFTWHCEWYDIHYDPATWNFDDLIVNMTKNEIYDMPFVQF